MKSYRCRVCDNPLYFENSVCVSCGTALGYSRAERAIVPVDEQGRYVDAEGEATDAANPNGSWHNIAGIINDNGNVLGMMPHPERAMEELLGSTDGIGVFTSLAASLSAVGS